MNQGQSQSFIFEGTTPVTPLWTSGGNGNNIPAEKWNGGGNPFTDPSGVAVYEKGSRVNYDPNGQIITWKTPSGGGIVPREIASLSIRDIQALTSFQTSNVTISRSINFKINSGVQYRLDRTCEPRFQLATYQNLRARNGSLASINALRNVEIVPVCCTFAANEIQNYCTTETTCTPIPSLFNVGNYGGYEVAVLPWNLGNCGQTAISLNLFGMTSYMDVTIRFNCNSTFIKDIDNICSIYCIEPENLQICKTGYRDVCFETTTDPDKVITDNPACQQFFTGLYTNFGPVDPDIETNIQDYCQGKYPTFEKLLNSTNSFDRDLCACHMPQTLYDEYRTNLIGQFPSIVTYIDNRNINERCLVRSCVSSSFPSIELQKPGSRRCEIPGCVQIVNFQNDGKIGEVTIDQGISTCVSILNTGGTGTIGPIPGPKPPPNPPNSTTGQSWISKYWWVFLLVGILLLMIIIVIIVVATGKKKKKKPVSY